MFGPYYYFSQKKSPSHATEKNTQDHEQRMPGAYRFSGYGRKNADEA